MAKIPLPERGQPVDLTYIGQIVKAVNELSTQVTTTNNKYVTIDTPTTAVKENVKTSDMRVIGAYRDISNKTVIAGSQGTFSVSFSSFKFPPVVTATLVNVSGTDAGRDASVVLTSVTASGVEGVVTFNTAGSVSVGVNIIAIGIPN